MGKAEKLMAPVHPGEILRGHFMKPLGLSVNKVALELHVPATRIGEIVQERRRITAETAPAPGAVLQDQRGILAGLAEFLRFGARASRRQKFGDRAALLLSALCLSVILV